MEDGLENLARMEYPGRFIIIGQNRRLGENPENAIIVYGITGRSSSSRARRMVFDKDGEANVIRVVPTDEKLIQTGNSDLLIYPAFYISDSEVIVSNGKQTEDIYESRNGKQPLEILTKSLNSNSPWSYEPDAPNYTPRISGCANIFGSPALSIIKLANDDIPLRQFFEFSLFPGKGKLISTYTGININPLPSFIGEPLDVEFKSKNPKNVAEDVWGVLKPEYRVSVACIFLHSKYEAEAGKSAIINREDRE